MKDTFSDCLDDDAMNKAIDHLPDSVEAMYTQILTDRIFHHQNRSNKVKARLIFTWLTYSVRPLTLWELACAASLPDPRKVLEICTSSLITLQQEGDRWPKLDDEDNDIEGTKFVQFDHFSVQEYLTSEHLLASDETAYFHASPLLGHLTIAEVSVAYLLKTRDIYLATWESIKPKLVYNGDEDEEESDAPSQRLDPWEDVTRIKKPCKKYWPHDASSWAEKWPQFALLGYTVSWYKHVQQADAIKIRTDQDSENEMREATPAAMLPDPEYLRSRIHRFFGDKTFLSASRIWAYLSLTTTTPVPHEGLSWMLSKLLLILEAQPSPLWLASLLNLPDNVRRLLQSGHSADVRLRGWPSTGETPLPAQTKAWWNNLKAWGDKPIQIAATLSNLETLDVLLEHKAILEQSELDWVANSNTYHGPAVMNAILTARPHLVVTQNTVKAAEMNNSWDILEYFQNTPDLLDPSGDNLMDLVKRSLAERPTKWKFRNRLKALASTALDCYAFIPSNFSTVTTYLIYLLQARYQILMPT